MQTKKNLKKTNKQKHKNKNKKIPQNKTQNTIVIVMTLKRGRVGFFFSFLNITILIKSENSVYVGSSYI